ncbi:hypothetical protein [Bosea sp. UNC402CLCol]|uniref:hypothetical protein n=1 Tax=Bosea sp. UNC402CLCol TaxID=1510531 RepID=UPI000AD426AA|nr:hypothetical protein [Bosea sp. UNC402CLCol]
MLLTGLLGGCAYKPLKAPCAADEDGSSIASYAGNEPLAPAVFTSLTPCGPMRPI